MQSDITLRQALVLNLACAAGLKMFDYLVPASEDKEAGFKHKYLLFQNLSKIA